ncbi:MAG: DegV family protein [Lachnospiraceae bacterium]|nr:DegV family protein [Lachnospiraceae bacterium]
MSKYILSCCSTADITQEIFDKRDIHYVCFHFELDGVEYADDLGKSVPFSEFYQKMVDGAMTKTSQVNVEEYVDYFEPFLKEGKDILHLTLSGGISGAVNSANIARDELSEKYPDRKIYVVDSLAASSGYGLLMDRLADLRDEGKTIDEVYEFAVANRLKLQHWFFTSDLTFFIRGGRVSKAAGAFAGALNICPLLNVDSQGKLAAREKIRTKNKVIRRQVEKMKELAAGGTDYTGKVFISQSACYADAKAVADLVKETFPHMNGKPQIFSIGTTIGAHTGPGTVALFFWGDERKD